MDHIFAGVKWHCTVCGNAAGTCDCFVKCECGRSYLRGEGCPNQTWHIAKQFAEEAADLIVKDMAQSYKMFQREHMVARLKRAVVRQTQPIILATFDGVEAAKRDQSTARLRTSQNTAETLPKRELAGRAVDTP